MSKYDGPSYKKNQKRLKKSEFPFYSDSAHATKKDNLFDRSKTSKYDKPIKITREINVELTEKLFSEQVNETNDERIKRLPSRQHNNHSETVQPHSHERNDLTRKNQGKILEEIVKSEEATYQERRSSTPFKVQKIPSPYYGLNKKLEQEIKKVNYRKIAVHLEKEEEEFILFDNYLCDHISKLYIEEEKIIHIEQPTIIEQPKKKLSRSLAAMIEEEQENQINSQKQRTNYFSEKSEREESTRNVNSETDFTTKPNDLNSSNELDKLETTKEKILNKKIQSEKIFVKKKDKMTEEEIGNLEIKAALSRFNYIEKNSNKDKRKIDTVGIENKLTNKKLVDRQKYDDDKHWGNEKFLTEADSDLEVNSNPELDLESGADSDLKVNSNPELDLDLEADSEP
ncbi:hypothetical protein, partial [Carnobacterium sp.]|uniref:hypothetical protein n=1 Tax=Carnobacterium sp. TaxID=48221 RepID=UPI003C740A66